MDFTLTTEQRRLVDGVTEFARANVSADAAVNDSEARFDREAWQRCAEYGVHGWPVPDRFGGSGMDPLDCVLAFEALGYGCRDNGLVFAINNHVWACTSYVLAHGSPEQQERYLPGLADGSVIGAHALTEHDAGSDVLSLTTAARRSGDGYVVNGVKTFISNAPCADLFVLFVRTGNEKSPQRDLSAFLLPRDTPGVSVSRVWDKAGLRGTPMGEVRLDDVWLGREQLLGAEGDGYQVFMSTADWERGFMSASSVGVLRRLMEDSVRHAGSRRQFGRPIGDFQAVSHRLADMRVRVELAQLMLYRFGWLRGQNRLALLESSILKLYVSESLMASGLDAMRIHGARGYIADFGVEREVRDALGGTLYGGTSDIHRSIIARLTGVASDA
jgi:alkylation response protein AidB-like acyl-CoA dehydrogenase